MCGSGLTVHIIEIRDGKERIYRICRYAVPGGSSGISFARSTGQLVDVVSPRASWAPITPLANDEIAQSGVRVLVNRRIAIDKPSRVTAKVDYVVDFVAVHIGSLTSLLMHTLRSTLRHSRLLDLHPFSYNISLRTQRSLRSALL